MHHFSLSVSVATAKINYTYHRGMAKPSQTAGYCQTVYPHDGDMKTVNHLAINLARRKATSLTDTYALPLSLSQQSAVCRQQRQF